MCYATCFQVKWKDGRCLFVTPEGGSFNYELVKATLLPSDAPGASMVGPTKICLYMCVQIEMKFKKKKNNRDKITYTITVTL